MQKIILLTLLFYSFVINSQTHGIITYGQEIIISTDMSSKKSGFSMMYHQDRIKTSKVSKKISYKLRYNLHESTFNAERFLGIDGKENDLEDALLHVDGDGRYYFSSKTNISLWDHDVFGERIILADTISSSDWKISKETKKIGKHNVIKAIKKRILSNGKLIDIIAWFAPEIQNNFGPLGYCGLPGLILEIQEGNDFIIYAKKINFKKKIQKISKPSKGKLMGKKEYNKFIDKAALDFLNN